MKKSYENLNQVNGNNGLREHLKKALENKNTISQEDITLAVISFNNLSANKKQNQFLGTRDSVLENLEASSRFEKQMEAISQFSQKSLPTLAKEKKSVSLFKKTIDIDKILDGHHGTQGLVNAINFGHSVNYNIPVTSPKELYKQVLHNKVSNNQNLGMVQIQPIKYVDLVNKQQSTEPKKPSHNVPKLENREKVIEEFNKKKESKQQFQPLVVQVNKNQLANPEFLETLGDAPKRKNHPVHEQKQPLHSTKEKHPNIANKKPLPEKKKTQSYSEQLDNERTEKRTEELLNKNKKSNLSFFLN